MTITRTRTLIALMLGFVVGAGGCYYYMLSRGYQQPPTATPSLSQDSTGVLLSTSRIQAELKTTPNEEDVVLSQKYTTVVNGEKVSVPIVKRTTGTPNQPAGTSGSANLPPQGVKATIDQTIDLTPVLSKLRPSWELGGGVSYINKQTYVPLSIQRNYKVDKALELTVLIDTDGKAQGAMVQHKWLIK